MKRILQTALFIALLSPLVVFAGDYVIELNGKASELDLDQETEITLSDGTKLKVKLTQKEFLTHQRQMFSFEHKNNYRPNSTDLGDGVSQTALITPLGSGILIQEYTTMDPSGLVDMMLAELTKEEVDYGYSYEETDVKRKVGDQTVSGKSAITKYQNDEWTREVVTLGGKDKGLLIVTFIEKANAESDLSLIKHFWKTLKLSEDLK